MEWKDLSTLSCRRFGRRLANFTLIARTLTTISLSFKHFGDSKEPNDPAVLILHGLLGNKTQWEGIGKTLSNMTKRAVISVDLRNHGNSPHVNTHNYIEMAEDVATLLKKQGIDKSVLLGHSMGGRVAMSLALMNPVLIAGLIVVDISPVSSCRKYILEFPEILDAMRKINFEDPNINKLSDAKQHAKKALKDFIKDDLILRVVLSNIDYKKDRSIGWTCNLDVLINNYKYVASFPKSLLDKTYSGSVMFIGGQKSDFLPPDDLPRIREIFPQSTITYIPKSGHMLHLQDPKGFLERVISFIRNNNIN